MANGMKWELLEWGDGTIRLTYWDSMTGEDISFVLNNDDSADRSTYEYSGEDDETGVNILTPVNIVRELRRIAQATE